jgi:hypothetical protein
LQNLTIAHSLSQSSSPFRGQRGKILGSLGDKIIHCETNTSLSKVECRKRTCCRHRKTQTELPRGTEGELGVGGSKTNGGSEHIIVQNRRILAQYTLCFI